MKKRNLIISALSLCFIIILCECTRRIEAAEPVDIYAGGPVTAPLDSLFGDIFSSDGPGGIVMVLSGDSILYERAFGYADITTKEPITDRTVFNYASLSKFFCATALLKLAEQGKVSIDDSLSMYFPEFPAELFDKITLRHILTHTSGLPDLRPRDESEWDKYLREQKSVFGFSRDYRLYGTEKEHSQVFKMLKNLEFEPGTTYQPNDPGYVLIAPLVEKVTGEDFQKWMNENIFEPAGMSDQFYIRPGYNPPHSAHGYALDENGAWKEYDYGEAEFFITKADRGLFGSMHDFRNWMRALVDGKIISNESRSDMCSGSMEHYSPHTYLGLGVLIVKKPGQPTKACHRRSNGGFTAVESSWPEIDLHYVILSNRNDWDYRATIEQVDSILLDKIMIQQDSLRK